MARICMEFHALVGNRAQLVDLLILVHLEPKFEGDYKRRLLGFLKEVLLGADTQWLLERSSGFGDDSWR